MHVGIVYPQPLHRATLDFIHTETMRRAQSVRHYTRTSVSTTGTNDMGALKEVPEESSEVSLRRQLLDKSKENDKVAWPVNFCYFVADCDLTFISPYAAPRPNSGTPGAARAAATHRGYPGVAKGIQ